MIKRFSKKISCIGIIVPVVAFLSCSGVKSYEHVPFAVHGVVNAGSYDFVKDGPINLRGDWKFIWMKDDPSFADLHYDDSSWSDLAVRGYWTGLTGKGSGYGWYRLHVRFDKTKPAPGTVLGLNVTYINTAYELYINGQYAASSGRFGKSVDESVPQILPRLVMVVVPRDSDEIVIAVRCSNFHHREGGFFETPRLGLYNDLREGLWQKDFINIILFGIILMMGIYHLFIWLGRRKDMASLYFTLGCFIIFFRYMALSSYFELLFPCAGLFEFKMKLIYISISGGVISFVLFFNEIFPGALKRRVLHMLVFICITLVIFALVFPCRVYSHISYIYESVVFIAGIWMFAINIIAAARRQKWSGYLLPGCFLFFITGLSDLLAIRLLLNLPQTATAGLTGLIFCQAIVLSKRYADAYKTAEHLKLNLQQEVGNKTRDLMHRTKEAEESRSEIEKSHEKLMEMDRYRSIFFQNITHEFRTPLTIIIGYIERIIETSDTPDPEGLRERYSVILSNARMLLKLINQLLDMSKIDSRMMKIKEEPIDLVKLIRSITSFFEYPAQSKGMTLNVNIEADSIAGLFDSEKIEKIMYNLLSNAFKFTGKNGRINVTVRSIDEHVYISVSDSGTGISAEKLPRIFDRFYQGELAARREFEGTGIGLSLVSEYVEVLSGRIEVTSTVGVGSSFTVILPLKKVPEGDVLGQPDYDQISRSAEIYLSDVTARAKHVQADNRPFAPVRTRRDETILIVEDNSDMRSYLRDILGSIYRIREAVNGKEALASLETFHPDLIISDIMMPVMDGYNLLFELKRNPETSRIPVILLTAKGGDEERFTGLEYGADDYLVKPFNSRELLTRTASLVRLYRYQKLLSERNRIIESDLAIAREIQLRLIFTNTPVKQDNFFAFYRPYDKVAGDFYSYVEESNAVHIFIADVSGHGLAAAFLSLIAKNELANIARGNAQAGDILEHLNNTICRYAVNGSFMTGFYLIYHRETGLLNYSRAGHIPPLFIKRNGSSVSELKPTGTALGIFAGLTYENREFYPEAGDRLVLYTDGLTECRSESREMFGVKRLGDLVKECSELDPCELARMIMSGVTDFIGTGSFDDDITLLVYDVPERKDVPSED